MLSLSEGILMQDQGHTALWETLGGIHTPQTRGLALVPCPQLVQHLERCGPMKRFCVNVFIVIDTKF
eukprot:m.314601 g.314601  ORF g.314601 m.314601 type:complete len:67 (+) comp16494_c4_seq13:84-284(+)